MKLFSKKNINISASSMKNGQIGKILEGNDKYKGDIVLAFGNQLINLWKKNDDKASWDYRPILTSLTIEIFEPGTLLEI